MQKISLWCLHGVGEVMLSLTLGFQDPGAVQRHRKVPSKLVLAEMSRRIAFKITRVGQLVGQMASERLGEFFGIVVVSHQHSWGTRLPVSLEAMGLEVDPRSSAGSAQ